MVDNNSGMLKCSRAKEEEARPQLASSSACMGNMQCGAALGVRTPFASPNGEQRGGLGWNPPHLRWLVALGASRGL